MKPIEDFLSAPEIDFVRAVIARPGCKHPYAGNEYLDDPDRPGFFGKAVWQRPEHLGLVIAVGSYKWEPGHNLVQALFVKNEGRLTIGDLPCNEA